MTKELKIGDRIEYTKVFTNEEVVLVGNIIGSMGRHHEEPNEEGYLLTQGLLTASLSIRLISENNILMYSMESNYLKKVWAGEEMLVINTIEDIFIKKSKRHILVNSEIFNKGKDLVFTGSIRGILLDY